MRIGKYWQRIGLFTTAVVMAFGVLWPGGSVSAQSSAALSIAPKKDYVINSGDDVKDELRIRNLDDTKPLELSLRVIDFTYTDDGGTPKLMLDPEAPQTAWSLRSYMSVPKQVTVEAGASTTVPISVAIPKEVGAGSYYSAIIYSAGSEDFSETSNVGLAASGVTLVFTTVPGKVNEKLTVTKFGAYHESASSESGYKYFNWDEPKTLAYTLKNDGNVTEAPVGTITLKDIFGHEYMIKDINPSGSLALIGQTRTFKACIKQKIEDVNFSGSRTQASECTTPKLWPGYYRANLAGFYGHNGNNTQEFNANASFWYLPAWFIFSFLLALLIVGYFIWSVTERIRNNIRRRNAKKVKGAKKTKAAADKKEE